MSLKRKYLSVDYMRSNNIDPNLNYLLDNNDYATPVYLGSDTNNVPLATESMDTKISSLDTSLATQAMLLAQHKQEVKDNAIAKQDYVCQQEALLVESEARQDYVCREKEVKINILNSTVYIVSDLNLLIKNLKDQGFVVNTGPQK